MQVTIHVSGPGPGPVGIGRAMDATSPELVAGSDDAEVQRDDDSVAESTTWSMVRSHATIMWKSRDMTGEGGQRPTTPCAPL